MELIMRNGMIDYLACAHAIIGAFGYTGESASKIKYNAYLIM
jgi:hypothetical protein